MQRGARIRRRRDDHPLLAFLTILLPLTAASNCPADVVSGPRLNPANGHAYYLVKPTTFSNGTWSQTRAAALALGGDLATINDADENAFVLDFVLTQNL